MTRIKTGGRDFLKGQSGNPLGRPKESNSSKEVKKLSKACIRELAPKCLFLSVKNLKLKSQNENQNYIEWAFSNYLYNIVKKNDFKSLENLFSMLTGTSQFLTINNNLIENECIPLNKMNVEDLETIKEIVEKYE